MEPKRYEKYLVWLVISCIDFFSMGKLVQKMIALHESACTSLVHYTAAKQNVWEKSCKSPLAASLRVGMQDVGRSSWSGLTWTGFSPQFTWLLSVICRLLAKWEWQWIRALSLLPTCSTHTHTHVHTVLCNPTQICLLCPFTAYDRYNNTTAFSYLLKHCTITRAICISLLHCSVHLLCEASQGWNWAVQVFISIWKITGVCLIQDERAAVWQTRENQCTTNGCESTACA